MNKYAKVIIIAGAMTTLVACGASTPSASDQTTSVNTPAITEVDTTGSVETSTEAAEAEEVVPREYQNALRSAKQYLDYSGFSQQGLYDQLTSEYGDKYPAEAAQYAVDNVDADWDAEAREAAENYLNISPFSREELVNQLSSEYGDKFTREQAQAAVDAVY
ncbi:Ltp family lipoprotein [Corynebacterium sp. HS2168-gen11]|uniref:Ltp family lipoprotein n=1 Tax=Corynebacterium sp. HS2168-gen11 TaxID=2974027 RepID=UPI00216AF051|nr:Ltp family lipoprotein [Corynebacterium sp. HS2168-gen11]MCS4535263.1 Ltp family lipoprotein [Corynebacterium sp. HS2168-gen11]